MFRLVHDVVASKTELLDLIQIMKTDLIDNVLAKDLSDDQMAKYLVFCEQVSHPSAPPII